MSTAEIVLGSRLYIDAVTADMPSILNSHEDYTDLRDSFRGMTRWLLEKDLISKDAKTGKWKANHENISSIDEKTAESFAPLYQKTVESHEGVMDRLSAQAKPAYLETLQNIHMTQPVSIEPEIIHELNEEDLQKVTAASLTFLDAVHQDPANAAFLMGADRKSMDQLSDSLKSANYLMPGENPDRTAPLGNQSPRGTREQAEDIYFAAATISANMKLPENLRMGDGAGLMVAASAFKAAVDSTRTDEVEVYNEASRTNPLDSDLTLKDSIAAHDVFEALVQTVDNAQVDTGGLDDVLVPTSVLDALSDRLAVYDGFAVGEALRQKDFQAPGISSESGNTIHKLVESGREMLQVSSDSTRFTGDEGSSLSGPNALEDDEYDLESPFEDDIRDDVPETSEVDETDMGAEYGTSDRFTRISRESLDLIEAATDSLINNGIGEALAANAGRGDRTSLTMSSGRDAAAFATLQEAMGAGRRNSTPEMTDRVAENMSFATWARLASREKLKEKLPGRVLKFIPGRNEFKGFDKPADDSVVEKRVSNWVSRSMLLEDRKTGELVPNIPFRRMLREAARLPIVAPTQAHGAALRAEAEKFVEREAEENQMRRAAQRTGRDLKSVELPAVAVSRFVSVAQASGSKAPATMTLRENGAISLTHDEAPLLKGKLDRIGNLDRVVAGYKLGNIPVEQLRAAVETGAKTITIGIEDDRPYAVTGKIAQAKTREKAKARHEDIVLS